MSELWQGLLQLIGAALVAFYQLIPSYGVAIVLLTVAVGVVLFPLTLKQTRSQRAMMALQPEVKKLQKQLKGERERLNQEIMALYKERGVNPAAGCLPLILQMPIWFALFQVLRAPDRYIGAGTELAAAIAANTKFLAMDLQLSPSGVLAAQGLVSLLPYLVLILIVVASGYYQTKQATASTPSTEQTPQAQQMQAVTRFMPLLFGFFSWTLPTGLVLYFAASNLFRIGQQSLILRMEPTARPSPDRAEPAADTEPPAPPPARRKRRRKR